MIYTWVLYMTGAVTHDLYVGSLHVCDSLDRLLKDMIYNG